MWTYMNDTNGISCHVEKPVGARQTRDGSWESVIADLLAVTWDTGRRVLEVKTWQELCASYLNKHPDDVVAAKERLAVAQYPVHVRPNVVPLVFSTSGHVRGATLQILEELQALRNQNGARPGVRDIPLQGMLGSAIATCNAQIYAHWAQQHRIATAAAAAATAAAGAPATQSPFGASGREPLCAVAEALRRDGVATSQPRQ
jgi:hypothetical protein